MGGSQCVDLPGEQRNHGGFRHQRKAVSRHRTQQRRFVAKGEKHDLACAARLLQGSDHGTRGLRKLPLSRHLGAKIGEGFDRAQKPPEIIFWGRHSKVGA